MSVLAAENLSVSIKGKKIVEGVSCSVETGAIVGLIGPNGAGKSTLLKAMCRLIEPQSGHVVLDGSQVAAIPKRQFAKRVSYLPQGHALHWRLNVEHLVSLGRLPHRSALTAPSANDVRAIEAALERADVAQFADRYVDTLSGGERARSMLARALAVEVDIILADEPVASLDPYHSLHVMELLRDLAREGRGVVVVLHDLSLAMRFCDRLLLMQEGRLVGDGLPNEVLAKAHLAASYNIDAHYGEHATERYLVPWRRLGRGAPPS